MPNQEQQIPQFNKTSEYKWDIEKLRRLARRIREYEERELKESINEYPCHQTQNPT